jgi:ribonuclease P protein component
MEEKYLQEEEHAGAKSSQFLTRRDLNSSLSAKSFQDFDPEKLQGKQTFGRDEKLKSKKLIEQLFKEGKSVSQNGFTLVYLNIALSTFYPAQTSFSVPKRNFKHATDRNRVKRLMREVWRKNKAALYKTLAEKNRQLAIMWVYKGKALPDYDMVNKAMLNCINRLIKH